MQRLFAHLCKAGPLDEVVESPNGGEAREALQVVKQVLLLRLEQVPVHKIVQILQLYRSRPVAGILQRLVPETADIHPGHLA